MLFWPSIKYIVAMLTRIWKGPNSNLYHHNYTGFPIGCICTVEVQMNEQCMYAVCLNVGQEKKFPKA